MKIAAGGVPGSGLGDAKRAASFLQPFVARDSCSEGADDDADGELYRYLPQQGDAEATDAPHRVMPAEVYFDHFTALTWYRYTAIFGFVGTIAV